MHCYRSGFNLMLLAFCGQLVHAAEFNITVTAKETAASHAPIRIPIDTHGIDSPYVAISGSDFNVLGQITEPSVLSADGKAELVFVLPLIEANETTQLYGKTISAAEVNHGFRFADNPGKFNELSLNDRPVMRYMYEALDRSSDERIGETYKVFHHVYDPSGARYVTKGPGGLFPHHRGLFFGFNRISYGDGQQADIWHCRHGEHQAHREFVSEEAGPVLGRQKLAIDWHGRDDHVFATETRELTAYNTDGGILIEFATVLESKVGKVRLDGDPQHAGFQFRGSQDIPDKTRHLTYYVRPDGKGEPGAFRNWSAKKNESPQNLMHIDLPWLALHFVLDDTLYTCCYLDHPGNPKPARFSERDYGRFGSYFEYDLDEDHPLKLNYRIWLQEGEMTVDEITDISSGFVAPPTSTITVLTD